MTPRTDELMGRVTSNDAAPLWNLARQLERENRELLEELRKAIDLLNALSAIAQEKRQKWQALLDEPEAK